MGNKFELDKLFTKKGKDYTYTVIFFLIFSFLTFFVIRPNILAVFQAHLRIESLKKTNVFYETQIQNVVNTQSVLIEERNNIGLLNQAITKKPEVNELIRDITNTSNQDNLVVSKMNLTDVNLKDVSRNDQLKAIVFDLSLGGQFENYLKLIKDLYGQRRLKILKNIEIDNRTAETGSSSGTLIINYQLEGYYL